MAWFLRITHSRIAVVMAVSVTCALPIVAQKQMTFGATCGVCDKTRREAWGPANELNRSLLRHPLPVVPAMQMIPSEPWVVELILDLDGKICALKLLSGKDDAFGKALFRSLHEWTFSPFMTRVGAVCYRTRLFVYLRQREGRVVVEVPGITTPMGN